MRKRKRKGRERRKKEKKRRKKGEKSKKEMREKKEPSFRSVYLVGSSSFSSEQSTLRGKRKR